MEILKKILSWVSTNTTDAAELGIAAISLLVAIIAVGLFAFVKIKQPKSYTKKSVDLGCFSNFTA